jgi:transcriptional regulator of acetoin/glycerol metabolism
MVKIVALTHRDLARKVDQGAYAELLATVPMHPPVMEKEKRLSSVSKTKKRSQSISWRPRG